MLFSITLERKKTLTIINNFFEIFMFLQILTNFCNYIPLHLISTTNEHQITPKSLKNCVNKQLQKNNSASLYQKLISLIPNIRNI